MRKFLGGSFLDFFMIVAVDDFIWVAMEIKGSIIFNTIIGSLLICPTTWLISNALKRLWRTSTL